MLTLHPQPGSSSASTVLKMASFLFAQIAYVTKLLENLGLEKRKEKNIPAPGNVSEVDNSKK